MLSLDDPTDRRIYFELTGKKAIQDDSKLEGEVELICTSDRENPAIDLNAIASTADNPDPDPKRKAVNKRKSLLMPQDFSGHEKLLAIN